MYLLISQNAIMGVGGGRPFCDLQSAGICQSASNYHVLGYGERSALLFPLSHVQNVLRIVGVGSAYM